MAESQDESRKKTIDRQIINDATTSLGLFTKPIGDFLHEEHGTHAPKVKFQYSLVSGCTGIERTSAKPDHGRMERFMELKVFGPSIHIKYFTRGDTNYMG